MKRVKIGELKDQLSRHLRAVERGAVIDTFELVPLDSSVLERAAEPFPTPVGSLAAIHLASALLARRRDSDLALATHDQELAAAARIMGLPVLGLPATR